MEYITKENLKIINADEGSVLHFIKSSDRGYIGFGEVYFSTVKKNSIKAWKMHREMTLNLVVPVGSVHFKFLDARPGSREYMKEQDFILDQDPYIRLTVPPMIWFGFKGLSDGLNLLSNQANIIHNPEEVDRKPLGSFNVNWSIDV